MSAISSQTPSIQPSGAVIIEQANKNNRDSLVRLNSLATLRFNEFRRMFTEIPKSYLIYLFRKTIDLNQVPVSQKLFVLISQLTAKETYPLEVREGTIFSSPEKMLQFVPWNLLNNAQQADIIAHFGNQFKSDQIYLFNEWISTLSAQQVDEGLRNLNRDQLNCLFNKAYSIGLDAVLEAIIRSNRFSEIEDIFVSNGLNHAASNHKLPLFLHALANSTRTISPKTLLNSLLLSIESDQTYFTKTILTSRLAEHLDPMGVAIILIQILSLNRFPAFEFLIETKLISKITSHDKEIVLFDLISKDQIIFLKRLLQTEILDQTDIEKGAIFATKNEQTEIVKLLIQHLSPQKKEALLIDAAQDGLTLLAKALLETDQFDNQSGVLGRAWLAAVKGDNGKTAKTISDSEKHFNQVPTLTISIGLIHAAKNGLYDLVKTIVESKKFREIESKYIQIAIDRALENENLPIIEFLFESSLNIELTQTQIEQVLNLATQKGNASLISKLIQAAPESSLIQ